MAEAGKVERTKRRSLSWLTAGVLVAGLLGYGAETVGNSMLTIGKNTDDLELATNGEAIARTGDYILAFACLLLAIRLGQAAYRTWPRRPKKTEQAQETAPEPQAEPAAA